MAKGVLLVIAPPRNTGAKGIMKSRADMMNDPEDVADQGADEDTEDAGGSGTCTVPISSISVDGTPPSVGDKVNFSIEGTVNDIQGGMASSDINTVDGEAATQDDGSNAGGQGGPES